MVRKWDDLIRTWPNARHCTEHAQDILHGKRLDHRLVLQIGLQFEKHRAEGSPWFSTHQQEQAEAQEPEGDSCRAHVTNSFHVLSTG